MKQSLAGEVWTGEIVENDMLADQWHTRRIVDEVSYLLYCVAISALSSDANVVCVSLHKDYLPSILRFCLSILHIS